MKKIIEYLMIFIVFLVFLPNNYLTTIYIAYNGIAILIYCAFYLKNRKNVREKQQFNVSEIINIAFVLCVNLVAQVVYVNIIFAYLISLYFLLTMIVCLLKKDYCFEKQKFYLNPPLDIYFIGIIVEFFIFKL